MKKHKSDPKSWGDATKLVRGGLDRSPHGETSEALFLNSGVVYDEPETAERRFSGEDDGYVYGRYGNPTVTMFEERLALLDRQIALLDKEIVRRSREDAIARRLMPELRTAPRTLCGNQKAWCRSGYLSHCLWLPEAIPRHKASIRGHSDSGKAAAAWAINPTSAYPSAKPCSRR